MCRKCFTFVVPRHSTTEHTFAFVMLDTTRKTAFKAFASLHKALQAWYRTPEGAAAWEESCEDFNVGDLANYTEHDSLTACLKRQGIIRLDVDVFSDASGQQFWAFDTVLGAQDRKRR